ncbi:unnamed protein product [Camellia sinensis]
MKELCDADSSADEPTEESADKSDPGVLNADVVDEDEDESQTTLALVCGNSATNKRTNLSLLYSFGHEDASIVAEIDVNAPLCSSIPNEVIQHGACLGLGFPEESGDSRSGLHLSTPKRMVVSPLKKHKIKKLDIMEFPGYSIMAVAGLAADGRQVVARAKSEATNYESELKLSQSNRIFRPNEPLEGKIITKLPSSISHNGIRLTVNGSVTLQLELGLMFVGGLVLAYASEHLGIGSFLRA